MTIMKKRVVLCCVLVSLFRASSASVVRQDLTGVWTVFNNATGLSVQGRVPGTMYTALRDKDVIHDPYYRDNNIRMAWIGHENWTYARTFEVSSAMAQSQSVLLVAQGIDTVSTVVINGQHVGSTDNMFVTYTWEVKPYIKPGNNTIQLAFQSATEYARKQAASYPYDVPPDCYHAAEHGECHVNFIRKAQCSFAWDWGPSFPTQGIWKPIYLVAFNSAILDQTTLEVLPGPSGQGWVLKTRSYFRTSGNRPSTTGHLAITLDKTSISETHNVSVSTQVNWVEVNITVPQSTNVQLWWPNGYGNQTLYDVIFTFTSSDGEMTSQKRRIGFRTAELVQDPVSADPKQGLTFYFRINGLPVFMKGANWVPADSFLERVTKDRLRSLLQSAADAHMTGLRVWGGGIYETDVFYDLADELGLLLYHDMMFSDGFYPTNPAFLASVTTELQQNIRRLMHRPSIAAWDGSNENENAIRANWYHVKNVSLYYADYIKLYRDTVMATVTRENPSRVYLTSSPSNGRLSFQQGLEAQDPQSDFFGDIHYYNDTIDQWQPYDYHVSRFTSEYGTRGYCSYQTLLPVMKASDMTYNSTVATDRQDGAGGNAVNFNQTVMHLNWPSDTTPEPQRFKDSIYLTQINQAMAVKAETEHYRRHQGSLQDDGRGLTMGAMYWMLNDIWQAPTYASIDYSGRWKMLHYYARKFFNPLLVSPYLNGSILEVHVVVDEIPTVAIRDPLTHRLRFEPMRDVYDVPKSGRGKNIRELSVKTKGVVNGTLYMIMLRWDNWVPLKFWTVPYKLNTTAQSVFSQNVSSMMSDANCTATADCFVYCYLNDPLSGSDNFVFLAEPKDSNIQNANTSISEIRQVETRIFTVTVVTDAHAPFVWLEAGSIMGRFSDNGFLMYNQAKLVNFTAWQNVDRLTLQDQMTVTSLADVYRT
ncbi:beta-mannosidase-like [Littorina saxatilis]|uniref:beta-mannosidase n=1 Tax=Littorina saxatilis TaxID=31220 RepID=A0AAN9ASF2_9CAEN